MKLKSSLQTTNFVLFDLQLKLKKYLNAKAIMDEYFVERYKKYEERKEYLLSKVINSISRFKENLILKKINRDSFYK